LAKLKIAISLALLANLAVGQKTLNAQECPEPTHIFIGNVTVDPCMPQRLNIPVYMTNPCPVGGFSIKIYCTDPNWLRFIPGDTLAADTFGCAISDWEAFQATVLPGQEAKISVLGIADMPGGDSGIFLPPGSGWHIFTIHPVFDNFYVADTSQLLNYWGCSVSDTTGWFAYDLILHTDSVYVDTSSCFLNPRGDANCSGNTNGVDVTYLVNFFKGMGPSFCGLCSGDVNNNDQVNGIDVSYLVNYLKGFGPAPEPCD